MEKATTKYMILKDLQGTLFYAIIYSKNVFQQKQDISLKIEILIKFNTSYIIIMLNYYILTLLLPKKA